MRVKSLIKLFLVDDPLQLLTSTWLASALPARTPNPNAQLAKRLPLHIFEIHALALVVQRLHSVPFAWFGLGLRKYWIVTSRSSVCNTTKNC